MSDARDAVTVSVIIDAAAVNDLLKSNVGVFYSYNRYVVVLKI